MIYNAIIFANGEIPTHQYPMEVLKNVSKIVCCDGAVEKLIQLGYIPTVIVGDLDSISNPLKQQFESIIYPDKDFEFNDLQKAIRFCLNKKWTKIAILGGFGLREDHALANLSIMLNYTLEYNAHHSDTITIDMISNSGIFSAFSESTTFESYSGQQISIFSFKRETKLTFKGLKYPVTNRSFYYLWEGSLNEAVSDQFSIECSGGEVVVFLNY
jgi:thiamine pyrophosphokinase